MPRVLLAKMRHPLLWSIVFQQSHAVTCCSKIVVHMSFYSHEVVQGTGSSLVMKEKAQEAFQTVIFLYLKSLNILAEVSRMNLNARRCIRMLLEVHQLPSNHLFYDLPDEIDPCLSRPFTCTSVRA